jgi:hypothetical protein
MSAPRRPAFPIEWTEASVNQLRRLWRAGLTAAKIVEVMGPPFTRNAILGKAWRLGLASRRERRAPRPVDPAAPNSGVRADGRSLPRPWVPADDRLLGEYRAAGLTSEKIGEKLGRTKRAIERRAEIIGLPILPRGQRRARKSAPVPAPPWVPADLRHDYVELAGLEGEFAAAAWARREKRAMAA